jgi:hypothetical protein
VTTRGRGLDGAEGRLSQGSIRVTASGLSLNRLPPATLAGRHILRAAAAPFLCASPLPRVAHAFAGQKSSDNVETIVVVRHGEKPKQGLGLLTCQGLNRALMLPDYFAANFPRPGYIFAPDPKVKATELHGDGQRYDYVRPLPTIGPTAIRFGVPINTQLPFNDPGLLADTLLGSKYHNSTVYVAWEHTNIVDFATVLLTRFGRTDKVPDWANSD